MPGWYDPNLKNPSGADNAHIARYLLARGFVNPGEIVVDAACGTGYGSRLLAEVAKFVHGYDIDRRAVSVAVSRKTDNTAFHVTDLERGDIVRCDVAVSIETLEHLVNPENLVKKFYRRANRLFVFSVPLNEEAGANPFHNTTFTRDSIVKLVTDCGWKMFHSFMQGNHFIGVAQK